MAKPITTKKFATNVIVSITAQLISLIVSVVLNLVVPKFIDGYQYAYWQTYALYVGYVGILHFGLLDGLVLRYSKYDYEELDRERLRSQFLILLLFTSFITVIISLISTLALGGTYKYIFILVAIGVVTKNFVTYGSYMFQITNRINKYAVMTICQRVAFGLITVVLLILKVNEFYWYCIADLMGDAAAIIIGLIFNRGLYFGKLLRASEAFRELKENISSGLLLMLANWSAMLLVGGAKMIVQWHWDELLFGRVSFAFSISNLFLTFVSAISVVLFPSLKRIDEEKLPEMYKSIRNVLSILLFGMMIFYFFGCWILGVWLPKYSDSLVYLGILLPIIIYSSKVNLLTNNYLKVYRKEKTMLAVNFISITVGMAAFCLCAFVFDNLYALLICVVIAVTLNSILSEIFVLKIIRMRIIKEFIIEAVMTIGFILSASMLPLWIGCLVYTALFVGYCLLNGKTIVFTIKNVLNKKKEDKQ